MKLIFCEKPSMGAQIAKVLGIQKKANGYIEGDQYFVTWAAGHFVGLATPEEHGFKQSTRANLPMIPTEFKLAVVTELKDGKQVVSPYVKQQLATIKTLFKKASEIIVATDAGREGELIFRNIYQFLECKKPFKRLWTSSLTDSAIKKAFSELKEGVLYDPLYFAARARSQADWLVGLNMTSALTIALQFPKGSVAAAGRVQTPTLSLICKRYLENKNFKKTPFWKLKMHLHKDNQAFVATSKETYENEETVKQLFSKINQALAAGTNNSQVTKLEVVEREEKPPLLLDLGELQKRANIVFDYSLDKTQEIAQSLYEKKFISYPRTGSRFIPEDVFACVPDLLREIFDSAEFKQYKEGYNLTKLNKYSVNDLKVTDHHALLTTELVPEASELNQEEKNIYKLIQVRMLEAFSDSCMKNITTAEIKFGITFVAKGVVIKDKGWRVFETIFKGGDDEEKTDEEKEILPELSLEEKLRVDEVKLEKGFTKPKPIYTDASLISAMQNCGNDITDKDIRLGLVAGIGTPASREPIIKKLYKQQYITKEGKKIIPTEKGLKLMNWINEFPFTDVALTGRWEHCLSAIAAGKMEERVFMESIIKFTQDNTAAIFKKVN